MKICDICGSDRVFYRRLNEGVSFCASCFRLSIEKRVKKTISEHDMLSYNDCIAIAVSGGKDSLVLATLLASIEKEFPHSRLIAVTIDEGISGYSQESVRIATSHCRRLGIEHRVFSFRELYGVTMDEVVRRKRRLSPCSYCGVLRRKAINYAAKTVCATKIATAHNLDDQAQTVLLNLFHGQTERIARIQPILLDPSRRFLPRVKPLHEIPEREIVLYAYLCQIRFQETPCPYGGEALRGEIRRILNRLEETHPGIKHTIYRSARKLITTVHVATQAYEGVNCEKCGDPSTRTVCEACSMIEEMIADLATGEAVLSLGNLF